MIELKSLFTDWHEVSDQEAREYAKMKMKMITTSKNDDELIEMINSHFRGIQFTIEEMKNEKE